MRGSEICREWIEFQDWDLYGLCDSNAPWGNIREERTIDELKMFAEENGHDGFTVLDYSDEAVYFKNCALADSKSIVRSLTEF